MKSVGFHQGFIMEKSIYSAIVIQLIIALSTFPLLAQEEIKSLTAKFITEDINIDGILDEAHQLRAILSKSVSTAKKPTPT